MAFDEITLSLPPAFRLKTLREAGDAFTHAQAIAQEGAGTLVWARHFHLVDFALVLEPEAPLAQAKLAFYAAMNAVADALSLPCPPEKPIAFEWPGAILIDGGLAGGCRLALPGDAPETEPPAWMVFGAMIRLSAPAGEETGRWQRGTALEEEGFEEFSSRAFIESASRYLLSAMHEFEERGPQPGMIRYLQRLKQDGAEQLKLSACGGIETAKGHVIRPFTDVLGCPAWLDPATGEPRQ